MMHISHNINNLHYITLFQTGEGLFPYPTALTNSTFESDTEHGIQGQGTQTGTVRYSTVQCSTAYDYLCL